MNWIKEITRRLMQIFFGLVFFDCPGLNKLRNLILKIICQKYGKQNVVSKSVMFYVPHGLKKADVNIGNYVRISENVNVDMSSDIVIEDNVWLSENVRILNHRHIINGREWKNTKDIELTSGLHIGEDAWIGAGAMILPQVTYIGKGAIVGAGSIVTKNVEDYKIVAGNPAVVISEREAET